MHYITNKKTHFKHGARLIPAFILLILSVAGCIFNDGYYGLSKDDYNYVKRESMPGGELDFEQQLDKGQTYNYGEKVFSSREMALLMWGQAVKRIGITNRFDAISLYEEIKNEKLQHNERKALLSGFSM